MILFSKDSSKKEIDNRFLYWNCCIILIFTAKYKNTIFSISKFIKVEQWRKSTFYYFDSVLDTVSESMFRVLWNVVYHIIVFIFNLELPCISPNRIDDIRNKFLLRKLFFFWQLLYNNSINVLSVLLIIRI